MIKGALYPVNLLSHDDDPNWKVVRYPFVDAAPQVIAKMLPGFLVKFDATMTHVLPALAADDAALGGVIIDLPDPYNTGDTTVAVALSGSFNQRQIHYADAWSQGWLANTTEWRSDRTSARIADLSRPICANWAVRTLNSATAALNPANQPERN